MTARDVSKALRLVANTVGSSSKKAKRRYTALPHREKARTRRKLLTLQARLRKEWADNPGRPAKVPVDDLILRVVR